jgi:Zn-dependent protease
LHFSKEYATVQRYRPFTTQFAFHKGDLTVEKKEPSPNKLGTLVAIALKGKKLFVIIKTLKLLKPMITIGTMALSTLAYSATMGWQLALGFVIMIFIHEMGHGIALKQKGLPASAPIFIPFFGAAIFAPNLENRPADEAYVGYGGPLVGGIAALVLFLIVTHLPHPPAVLLLVSYTAALVNLFNMIPIRPLDGGRITQIIGSWFKYVGLAFLLAMIAVLRQPSLLLILILVLGELPLKKRAIASLAVFVTACMIIFMLIGIRDERHVWMSLVDVLIAVLFCTMYGIVARGEAKQEARKSQLNKVILDKDEWDVREETPEPPPTPTVVASCIPIAVRWKWLGYYLALTVGLYWLMLAHHPFLHAALRK